MEKHNYRESEQTNRQTDRRNETEEDQQREERQYFKVYLHC